MYYLGAQVSTLVPKHLLWYQLVLAAGNKLIGEWDGTYLAVRQGDKTALGSLQPFDLIYIFLSIFKMQNTFSDAVPPSKPNIQWPEPGMYSILWFDH